MTLDPGTHLGPYRIVRPLGAGGMGEVYLAEDTRLSRTVAVKVLPEHLSRHPEARQRFEREARAASSLNHPNICSIFDIGSQDGVDYMVMEHLEGETLAQRLKKGPAEPEEAVRIAMQIADGLDKAHRKGLIHRDLKPGNIMLTKAGAKLMDFGLAKSAAPGESPEMTSAPTMTSPLTTDGAIIGTFQYMAPEQLEGGEASVRSDIFAFGAVLYEMLAGERPFEGKTQASLVAAILKETPRPLSALKPSTPPAMERLVATCLEKDPDERRQSMHDLLLELRWIAGGGPGTESQAPGLLDASGAAPGQAGPASAGSRAGWIVATLALLVGAVASYWALSSNRPEPPLLHLDMQSPPGTRLDFQSGPLRLSPDGSQIALVAIGEDGVRRLWVRPLNGATARPLDGTEEASFPFWSPDGAEIAFFAGGKLKKVNPRRGTSDTISDSARAATTWGPSGNWSGAWGPDGTIVFSGGENSGLLKVPGSGGTPETIYELDSSAGEFGLRHPSFLPDGRHFLFSIRSGKEGANKISVGSLDGADRVDLMTANTNAVFSETGHILFWRDDAIRAQPFDAASMALTGDPVLVAPDARFEPDFGYGVFSISGNGLLAYARGGGATTKSNLTLRDRGGMVIKVLEAEGNFYSPAFSQDGRRVAVDKSDVTNNGDIWVFDVGSGTSRRMTIHPADESSPAWSPDGNTIVFWSSEKGSGNIAQIPAGGGSTTFLFESEANDSPRDWSFDGRYLLLVRERKVSGDIDSDLIVLEPGAAHEPEPFLVTPFMEEDGAFSPDSRWIAYDSNQSGRQEVYIKPFGREGEAIQISAGGGRAPKWARKTGELFFTAATGDVMTAGIVSEDSPGPFRPEPLFRPPHRWREARAYDVNADGTLFVIVERLESKGGDAVGLIAGWPAVLGRD